MTLADAQRQRANKGQHVKGQALNKTGGVGTARTACGGWEKRGCRTAVRTRSRLVGALCGLNIHDWRGSIPQESLGCHYS